jgi:hypothetical protein
MLLVMVQKVISTGALQWMAPPLPNYDVADDQVVFDQGGRAVAPDASSIPAMVVEDLIAADPREPGPVATDSAAILTGIVEKQVVADDCRGVGSVKPPSEPGVVPVECIAGDLGGGGDAGHSSAPAIVGVSVDHVGMEGVFPDQRRGAVPAADPAPILQGRVGLDQVAPDGGGSALAEDGPTVDPVAIGDGETPDFRGTAFPTLEMESAVRVSLAPPDSHTAERRLLMRWLSDWWLKSSG